MAFSPPVYNDDIFRQQFPAFADKTQYPAYALAFAWTMGANWLNQEQPPCWGLDGSLRFVQVIDSDGSYPVDSNGNEIEATWSLSPLQQAADLMGAVIARQLYASNGTNKATGLAIPGPLTSASDNGSSASYTLPSFGSSAFSSLLLSSPPYGPMLLALLQVSAGVGPYIPSGRMSWVPP